LEDQKIKLKPLDYKMNFRNIYQTPVSHQTVKIIPTFHQYSIPHKYFKYHPNDLQYNLNLAHNFNINHQRPQEISYKYSEQPVFEPEFHDIKFEDPQPENHVEFLSRDYHQQHDEQHEPLIFVTEANYKYSDEITTEDEDKNEIIEARDELMKILAAKTVERREINKNDIFSGSSRNNGTTSSMKTKTRKKRSFLSWWTSSAESTGKNEQLEVEEEKEPNEEENENFVSGDEKWLAGCLIQCIFNKNGATDRLEYPTLDGIVDMYTAGTIEQPFFMYTLKATNKCLKIVSNRYKLNRKKKPAKGLTCTIAYDVFECVTDAVNAYCNA
jgi:hypothetical protein